MIDMITWYIVENIYIAFMKSNFFDRDFNFKTFLSRGLEAQKVEKHWYGGLPFCGN